MQTIFEVYDDDGSVSYLHMGDEPKEHADHITGYIARNTHETFNQEYYKRNKAVSWSQSELRPMTLFPHFSQAISPMFKGVE